MGIAFKHSLTALTAVLVTLTLGAGLAAAKPASVAATAHHILPDVATSDTDGSARPPVSLDTKVRQIDQFTYYVPNVGLVKAARVDEALNGQYCRAIDFGRAPFNRVKWDNDPRLCPDTIQHFTNNELRAEVNIVQLIAASSPSWSEIGRQAEEWCSKNPLKCVIVAEIIIPPSIKGGRWLINLIKGVRM